MKTKVFKIINIVLLVVAIIAMIVGLVIVSSDDKKAAEAAEKEADLLLCDKNERKFISGMADRQVKENYQSLLRSVQDDRLRKEIKNILDSDE